MHKPNNANNCAIIGPTASVVSGLPAGLTITANANIKQEITNDDININTNDSNQNASNYTSKMNINGKIIFVVAGGIGSKCNLDSVEILDPSYFGNRWKLGMLLFLLYPTCIYF